MKTRPLRVCGIPCQLDPTMLAYGGFYISVWVQETWGLKTPLTRVYTALNMVFSVTYYLELHNVIFLMFTIDVIFYQVKMLMLYNDQTTKSTFVNVK